MTMLLINSTGWVQSPFVAILARPNLQHGVMTQVSGIVVHQTGSESLQSTLDSFLRAGATGTHFVIGKDGQMYQTASLFWKVWHVGKILSRCLAEYRCNPVEAAALRQMGPSQMNQHEMQKSAPDRYPSNEDAIGIELVGGTVGIMRDPPYVTVNADQNEALSWLVSQLRQNFSIPLTEVFAHPTVSRKDPHEAETANWNLQK